jgi:hypothetical protein
VNKLFKTLAAVLEASAAATNKSPEVAPPADNAAKVGVAFVQLLSSYSCSGFSSGISSAFSSTFSSAFSSSFSFGRLKKS